MDSAIDLNALTPEQLRQLSGELLGVLADKYAQLQSLFKQNQELVVGNQRLVEEKRQLTVRNDKLTFELALLRRH